MSLVLSLFPGIGLLDMAFEEEGFCVVRGPDLLWGGDVRRFHPPSGKFDGVIGGPPCQRFSRLAYIVKARYGEGVLAPDLIPEFERCVALAQPPWFVMENVPEAPVPNIAGYIVKETVINNRWLGEEQNRVRRFCFGTPDGRPLHVQLAALEAMNWEPAVVSTAGGRRASIALVRDGHGGFKPKSNQGTTAKARLTTRRMTDMCRLQGLPDDFLDDTPLTLDGKRKAIGNGVPLPMGRAIARAVKQAVA